ncbi:MAG: FHA domain-containing protein [Gammaproteobacteria bacterium]
MARKLRFDHSVFIRDLLILLALPVTVYAELPQAQAPNWLLFMLPALLASLVILGLLGILFYIRSRRPGTAATTPPQNSLRAQLVNLESKRVHPVDALPWRIGRSRINSLPVDDHSVSRVHAEINVDDSGNYHLTDLESLNGVYVNEKKIETTPIANGDIVDIGDIRFRFEAIAASPTPD